MFYSSAFYQWVGYPYKRSISCKNPFMIHTKIKDDGIVNSVIPPPGLYTWKINLPSTYSSEVPTILDYSRICWMEDG